MKYAGRDEVDENGIPVYFTFRIKELIHLLYPIFDNVCVVDQGLDFADSLNIQANTANDDLTVVNRALIATKVLLGKIRAEET